MDIVGFAIWKFRTVEGILLGMHPYDVTTTRYEAPRGDVTWIRYDMAAEKAVIETDDGKSRIECNFCALADMLQRLGMYRLRPEHERHSCTIAPKPE